MRTSHRTAGLDQLGPTHAAPRAAFWSKRKKRYPGMSTIKRRFAAAKANTRHAKVTLATKA